MCGINGIAFSSKSTSKIDSVVLRRMRDAVSHRGPDDRGEFVCGAVGLGHRRLSIVDVAAGAQPMTNEDERLQIVFNGEIYNHADYRNELIASGHRYKTHCDTETILHLYEEYGAGCVERLRGMFAFAIWDRGKNELFVARDRLGVKPLYYVFDAEGSLFFASEIKSLIAAGAVRPEINFAVLPDHFANRGASGEDTLFLGIKKLLPGHFLTWRDGEIKIRKYWDVSYTPKIENRSERDLIREWSELFRKSVELRLMADVPLGMFLSGGIDSSAIAATMATLVPEPIKTFSVAFQERGANELEYARLIARQFKTDHHEITVTPEQFFAALPRLVWHEDAPPAFDASVPLYYVSLLAQEHVKVVLTGEGADEMLGGYARYRKTLLNLAFGKNYERAAPQTVRAIVQSGIGSLPQAARQKLSRTFLNLPSDIESLYFDNFAVFPSRMQAKLFSEETLEKIGASSPYSAAHDYFSNAKAAGLLDKMLYADTKTYLHELLMKQDRMSMAASIESRVPFLDHKLVEFTARLPERMKLRGNQTKWILREAMRGVLPAEILTRKKMGFPVPLGNWLRGKFRHIVDEYVTSDRALSRGIFNPAYVREIVSRHNAGENHDSRLWSLINFEIWQRQLTEGEAQWKSN